MQQITIRQIENYQQNIMSIVMAKLQDETGFAKEILDNPAKDVWNDL